MKRTELRRKTPLKSYTKLKPRGVRGKRLQEGDTAVSEYVTTDIFCELRDKVPKVICIGSLTPHHIQKRTYGASRHDLDGILIVCQSHHSWLHHHPAIARKRGWIIDSKSALLPQDGEMSLEN